MFGGQTKTALEKKWSNSAFPLWIDLFGNDLNLNFGEFNFAASLSLIAILLRQGAAADKSDPWSAIACNRFGLRSLLR